MHVGRHRGPGQLPAGSALVGSQASPIGQSELDAHEFVQVPQEGAVQEKVFTFG